MASVYNNNISLSRNISAIVKSCIIKEVVLHFTAVKKVGDKKVMFSTNFYNVLQCKF